MYKLTHKNHPLQAMPDEYKEKESINAYRNYYFYGKKHLHKWKNRQIPSGKELKLMKLTHKNHPSSIWTRESLSNYKWLVKLTKELCKEYTYTYRYGKVHKCETEYLQILEENNPDIPDIGFTVPRQAMPETYKIESEKIDDAIEAYRQYYFFEKNSMLDWKNRDIPEWIKEYKILFDDKE